MNVQTLMQLQAALDRLIALSRELEDALIRSDFAAIEAVTRELEGVLEGFPGAERVNESEASLQGEEGPADDLGMKDLRALLAQRLAELRAIEERNARLILEAIRLRQRWSELFARMIAPTYGPTGRAAVPRPILQREG